MPAIDEKKQTKGPEQYMFTPTYKLKNTPGGMLPEDPADWATHERADNPVQYNWPAEAFERTYDMMAGQPSRDRRHEWLKKNGFHAPLYAYRVCLAITETLPDGKKRPKNLPPYEVWAEDPSAAVVLACKTFGVNPSSVRPNIPEPVCGGEAPR